MVTKKQTRIQKDFSVGDKVTQTYSFPGEKDGVYIGKVVKVGNDFIRVMWNSRNDRSNIVEAHYWDFSVYSGGGPHHSPITKV